MAEWGIQTLLWYEMAYKDHAIPQAIVSSFDSSHSEQLHIFFTICINILRYRESNSKTRDLLHIHFF